MSDNSLPNVLWVSPDHDNLLATSDGRVFTYRGRRRALTEKHYIVNGDGRITINHNYQQISVKRLIATIFLDRPDDYNMVIHLDKDSKNNAAENLRWTNASDIHRYRKKKQGRSVLKLDPNTHEVVGRYKNTKTAAKAVGVSLSHMQHTCAGKKVTAAGWKWRYEGDTSEIRCHRHTDNRIKVAMVHPDTERVVRTFDSYMDASEFLGLKSTWSVSKAVKESTVYKKYLWRKVKVKKKRMPDPTKDMIMIDGYSNYYISNTGEIYSLHRKRYLKQSVSTGGYKLVILAGDSGKRKAMSVHRLVMKAYGNPDPDRPHVNHIDGCKVNNFIGNLEWCTISENILHAHVTGLNGNKIPVRQYSLSGKLLGTYCNIKEAIKETDVPRSAISNMLIGKTKTGYGFIWTRTAEPYVHKVTRGIELAATAKIPVRQYDLDGKLLGTYDSIGIAAKAIGISGETIGSVVRGLTKTGGGFVWTRTDEPYVHTISQEKKLAAITKRIPVRQYSPTGELLGTYNTMKSASDETGVSEDTIGRVIKGKSKIGGGFIWTRTTEPYDHVARYGSSSPVLFANRRRVNKLTVDGRLIETFATIADANRAIGNKPSATGIYSACRGNRKYSAGFRWEYA